MTTKVFFDDKQAEETFWASHASQENNNSGNHPVSHVIIADAVKNGSKFSYPAQSLFAKFNRPRSAKGSCSALPLCKPKVKQTWWSRRRVAKVHPSGNALTDRTIMSPMEEIALYGFSTSDFEDNDSTPLSLLQLQELHELRVAYNARYNPWDSKPVAAVKQPRYANTSWLYRPKTRRYHRKEAL